MRGLLDILLVLSCVWWLVACGPASLSPPVSTDPRSHAVGVISNGWHTAIIVPRADRDLTELVPEATHFPEARLLEFGWGDRDYYPAQKATLRLTLRAALMPTPAVMHVVGRGRTPEPPPGFEVVQVSLTEEGFKQMLRAIADTFERREGRLAEPVAPGLYRESHFYAARGKFHLFNTCNTWTARMLRAGGVPVSPVGVVTADDMMGRLRAAIRAD